MELKITENGERSFGEPQVRKCLGALLLSLASLGRSVDDLTDDAVVWLIHSMFADMKKRPPVVDEKEVDELQKMTMKIWEDLKKS